MSRTRLKDVVRQQKSSLKLSDLKKHGAFPVFGASGLIGYRDCFQSEKEAVAIIKDGAGIGRVSMLPKHSSVLGTMQMLEPKEGISNSYLFYFLSHLNLGKSFTGSTIPHIYFKNYSDSSFPDVSYNQQCQVAEKLDAIRKSIEQKNNQLSVLESLVKSRFMEMFGDADFKSVKIGEMIDKKKISAKKTYRPTDEIKYIDISSIDNQNHSITNSTNVIFGKAPSRAQQCLKTNDILISTVRPNLKNIAMLSFPSDNYVGSSGFCVLRPLKCNPLFLKYIVLSDDFTNAMIKLTNGANYPAIKNQDVLNYKMIDVPINLQNQFAAFVELVDKSRFVD